MRKSVVLRLLIGAAALLLPLTSATVLHGAQSGIQEQLAQARAATAQSTDISMSVRIPQKVAWSNSSTSPPLTAISTSVIRKRSDTRSQAMGFAWSRSNTASRWRVPEPRRRNFLPGVGKWEPESFAPDVWTKPVYIWSGKSIDGGH